jgi:hypothetical protein
MQPINEQPVTMDEIHEHYGVKMKMHHETSWMRLIEFRDNQHNVYQARLRWDESKGYEIFWNDVPPPELARLAERPEFEYTLDWYTADELWHNKSIPKI